MAIIFELSEWLYILWNIQTYKNFLECKGKKFFLFSDEMKKKPLRHKEH